MNNPQRQKILVDPTVQWAIARRMILHWTVFAACLVAVNMTMRVLLTLTEVPFMVAVKSAALSQLAMIGAMVCMLPMFILDTMKLSNRFVGPMYRLRQAILRLPSQATPQKLTFRDGDFWNDVAVDFNALAQSYEALRQQNQTLQNEVERLRAEHDCVTTNHETLVVG